LPARCAEQPRQPDLSRDEGARPRGEAMRRSRARRIAIGAAPALLLASVVLAADSAPVKPLEISDAVLANAFHVQGRPAFSPDSRTVAYTVCDPRRKKASAEDKEGIFATKGSAYLSMGC